VLTAYYMGGAYEVTGSAVKKYYSVAGMMVAVNDGTGLQYLLTDHLGSTVAVTNASGTLTSQQRYPSTSSGRRLPFGAARTIPNSPILVTDFGYTGQRKLDDGMGGIMDYKARFYSPYLNHFTQPDTDVPASQGVQGLNRYAYVSNNPLRYTDPTGHAAYSETEAGCSGGGPACIMDMWSGYDDADHMMAALRNWVRYHKDYSPVTDNKLSDEEKATVSIAMFQAVVEDTPKGASLSDILKNTFSSAALVGIFGIINEGINMSPHDGGGGGYYSHKGFIDNLSGMSDRSLNRTIRSLQQNIDEHMDKIISNPNSTAVSHWQKEIRTWSEQLALAVGEAARRGIR